MPALSTCCIGKANALPIQQVESADSLRVISLSYAKDFGLVPGQKICTSCRKVLNCKHNTKENEVQEKEIYVDNHTLKEDLNSSIASFGCSPLKLVSKKDRVAYGKRKIDSVRAHTQKAVANVLGLEIAALGGIESPSKKCLKKTNTDLDNIMTLIKLKFEKTLSNSEKITLTLTPDKCSVFICDFHREQAWERWLSKSSNGCLIVKEDVKVMLRRIAHSKTIEICKEAEKALKDSSEYNNHPKLKEYLKNTWLCIKKRWVSAYRQDRLLLNVNTNNGIERQNQSFKYSFLEKRKNSSLTAMLSICIEEFLPHKYDSYTNENTRANSSYRKYHEKIPIYLTNRPRPLVNHCMRMIDKLHGVDLTGINAVTDKLYNVASLKSNNRVIYQCYLGDNERLPTCSCPSWFNSAYPCKHFFAIFLKENLSWSAFGMAYRNSPYFVLDLLSEESSLTNTEYCPGSVYFVNDSTNVNDNAAPQTIVDSDQIRQTLPINNNQPFKTTYHTAAECRELLNEISQLSYLCDSQKIDTLFEELLKVKKCLSESLPTETGILFRPVVKPETWSKSESKLPKLINIPVTQKRKTMKRVGARYDLCKAAKEICVKVEKSESCYSEIVTDYSIEENCKIFTVSHESIKETTSIENNKHLQATISQVNNDVQFQTKFQCIQSLKSSLIGEAELFEIEKCQMLNDKIIHFSQQMMSIQLEINVGLQDPIKGQINAFNTHESTPFVQVLHDGNLHWICVSTYNCKPGEIFMFDSLFHGSISVETKKQICSILHCKKKCILVKVLPVQQQTNFLDCGLYAIAWARQILENKSIPSTSIMFEQGQMRNHLLSCIKKNHLNLFPVTENPLLFKKCLAKNFRIPLHCSCRMFWTNEDEQIFNRYIMALT
nr:uncharacterized protein LOC124818498 [Hydra vulgaris]